MGEVLLPICGQRDDMVYQRPPTLRVAMPAHKSTIGIHCDSDYDGHSDAEVNFLIPLTRVWGSNTLPLESSPGKGDFRPMELEYGEILRFNGNRCRHFTVPNDSGATRVSFDLRMLPFSLQPAIGEDREWRRRFKIGDYDSALARRRQSIESIDEDPGVASAEA